MDELRLDGRVAVVTGAGQGLGRHHALLLASRGAHVVVNDVGAALDGSGGSDEPAEQLVAEIVAAGGEAVPDTNTVATPEGGEKIIATALNTYGRIDILVNNAGNSAGGAFHNLTPEQVEAVIGVHLKGAFFTTKPAWVEFRNQGYGRVINTTSSTGILGTFGQLNYQSAKTGLWGFTRGLAAEGVRCGIKVNAIAPWAVSRMTRNADHERLRATGSKGTVVEAGKRLNLRAELVSPLVVVLAHESLEVTGQVYTVGGGRVSRYVIATTRGFFHPSPTPEILREHLADIQQDNSFAFYNSPEEELTALADRINTSGALPT